MKKKSRRAKKKAAAANNGTSQGQTAKEARGKGKQKGKTADQSTDKNTEEEGVSWLGPMLLWGLCICMLLFGIAFIVTARNAFYVLTGLLGLLLAAMLCPYIAERTKDLPALRGYYRFRAIIIILLFVLLFVMLFFGIS